MSNITGKGLKRKALYLLKVKGLDAHTLTDEQVEGLPFNDNIKSVIHAIRADKDTIETMRNERISKKPESTAVPSAKYDPQVEIHEDVTKHYVEEVVVLDEVVEVEVVTEEVEEHEVAMLSEVELRNILDKAPTHTKTAAAFIKHLMGKVEDKDLVDETLATTLSKEYAAAKKKAKADK